MVLEALPSCGLDETLQSEVEVARIRLAEVVHSDFDAVRCPGNRDVWRGARGTGLETEHGFYRSLINGETERVGVIAAVGILVELRRVKRKGHVMRARLGGPPVQRHLDTFALFKRGDFAFGRIGGRIAAFAIQREVDFVRIQVPDVPQAKSDFKDRSSHGIVDGKSTVVHADGPGECKVRSCRQVVNFVGPFDHITRHSAGVHHAHADSVRPVADLR